MLFSRRAAQYHAGAAAARSLVCGLVASMSLRDPAYCFDAAALSGKLILKFVCISWPVGRCFCKDACLHTGRTRSFRILAVGGGFRKELHRLKETIARHPGVADERQPRRRSVPP